MRTISIGVVALVAFLVQAFGLWFAAAPAQAQQVIDIVFPTLASEVTFHDDFGEPRAGHSHEGNDLIGRKMLPLYAVVDAEVSYLVIPEASWGYAVVLRDANDYTYHYLHINNDTPGTDDGNGGVEYAYAPGIERGAFVSQGQLIGWMGDSGNAEGITAHVHFEIRDSNDEPINPYPSLMAALGAVSYDPQIAAAESPDINSDKSLESAAGLTPCLAGSRIKIASSKAVYYCGADGKRYAFPNDKAYFTWYNNFNNVLELSDEEMAAVSLGGLVTYRPGIKMLKIQSDPKVYAVERGGVLRWVSSPEIVGALYGADWAKKVDDVSDAFFFSYVIGEPI